MDLSRYDALNMKNLSCTTPPKPRNDEAHESHLGIAYLSTITYGIFKMNGHNKSSTDHCSIFSPTSNTTTMLTMIFDPSSVCLLPQLPVLLDPAALPVPLLTLRGK